MSEALKTSAQTICEGTPSVTSSPELAVGHLRYVTPGGAMNGLCGQALARVNLSARQAKELGLLTSGTYGRLGCISLQSDVLTSSLANKLKQRSATDGSTLYNLIWKVRVTPAGRSLFRLAASVRRTSGNASISWPTPTTPSGGQKNPAGTSETGRRPDGSKATVTLGNVYMARIGAPLPPAFAAMLMGFPPEWTFCGVTAMQSMSNKRKRLSKPISNVEA